ncbi:MAG: Hsp20/alpha crystallin family [Candidatus Paceibacter sp.]|jgi:HSP20 family molecular chaperone IbpA|nr:Hsp20/alpha crystallin family [Candidatus Paceibacter sp.]
MNSVVKKEQLILRSTKRFLDSIITKSRSPYVYANIYERGAVLNVEMYMPIVKKDTLEIFSSERHLTIKGECNFSHASFKQVIRLPKKVKKEEVYAEFDRGVLEVVLPKAEAY